MADTPTPPHRRRVMIQHSPSLFSLGTWMDAEDPPIEFEYANHRYFKSKMTPRWVLYKRAVKGHGESMFDPRQQ